VWGDADRGAAYENYERPHYLPEDDSDFYIVPRNDAGPVFARPGNQTGGSGGGGADADGGTPGAEGGAEPASESTYTSSSEPEPEDSQHPADDLPPGDQTDDSEEESQQAADDFPPGDQTDDDEELYMTAYEVERYKLEDLERSFLAEAAKDLTSAATKEFPRTGLPPTQLSFRPVPGIRPLFLRSNT
jgi:hypothetical protein